MMAVILTGLVLFSACGRKGRVIPKQKMAAIYADMLVADQWLTDHPYARKTADTTFFYNPIFKKYGYTSRDYEASVRHYVRTPDKYAQILTDAADILSEEIKRMERIQKRQQLVRDLNAGIGGYQWNDFDGQEKWSVTLADTLMNQISGNAERRDSVRTDSLKTVRKLSGVEFAAHERKTL